MVNKANISDLIFFFKCLFTLVAFSLSLSYHGTILGKITLFVRVLQDVVRMMISRAITSGELLLFKFLVPYVNGNCFRILFVGMI